MKGYLLAECLIKLKLLKFLNLSFPFTTNNKKLKFPVINLLGFQNLRELKQGREKYLDKLTSSIFERNSGAFVDIGINIGQTLLKVKSIDLNREYIGFEPNPACCFYAHKICKINNFKDCRIIPAGLHSRNTLLTLFTTGAEDDVFGTVADENRGNPFFPLEQHVFVFKGDYLLKELNVTSISIIKIDVEGAEVDVIEGLKYTISTQKPFILCEVWTINKDSKAANYRKDKIDLLESFLREEGYSIGRFYVDGRIIILSEIDKYSQPTGSTCDYVFIPPGMEQFVQSL